MQKYRLLITASTFPRWEGDTEPRFILDLAKSLLPYFDVTVLAPSAPGAKTKEVLEGVSVIRYRYFPIKKCETLCYPGAIVPRIKEKKIRGLLVPFLFFGLWWKLLRILKNYDVVHANWLIPQGVVQGLFRKPFVVTGHGADVTSLNSNVFKRLKRHCLRHADCVTVVSRHLEKVIKNIYPNDKTRIISMGCNTKDFDRYYRINNYFEQDGCPVILFVGRLAEKKGVAYLIEAMKDIQAYLYIVGDGPLKKQLVEQAEGQKGKIFFEGSKTHSELRTIYASADIFVAPSITAQNGDTEGLGLVILEAMASGLPVVASNSGGISDLIQSGYNGILVPEKDADKLAAAINFLLKSPKDCRKIAANSKITVEKYSYEKIGAEYTKIIAEAARKGEKR